MSLHANISIIFGHNKTNWNLMRVCNPLIWIKPQILIQPLVYKQICTRLDSYPYNVNTNQNRYFEVILGLDCRYMIGVAPSSKPWIKTFKQLLMNDKLFTCIFSDIFVAFRFWELMMFNSCDFVWKIMASQACLWCVLFR